jgi:hypothetical protein
MDAAGPRRMHRFGESRQHVVRVPTRGGFVLYFDFRIGIWSFSMNYKLNYTVSFALVGCMFAHAFEGLWEGKAPSEVHLLTSAPLVQITSSTATSIDHVQHNAIFDAVHMASVPQDAELRLGGLTSPSTDYPRSS